MILGKNLSEIKRDLDVCGCNHSRDSHEFII